MLHSTRSPEGATEKARTSPASNSAVAGDTWRVGEGGTAGEEADCELSGIWLRILAVIPITGYAKNCPPECRATCTPIHALFSSPGLENRMVTDPIALSISWRMIGARANITGGPQYIKRKYLQVWDNYSPNW